MNLEKIRRLMIFVFIIGVAYFLNTSCLDQEGDLRIESELPQIVVDGIIVSGQKPVLFIGKTAPTLSNNLTFRIPESNVSVMLFKDGAPYVRLLPAEGELFDNVDGIPRSNKMFTLDSALTLVENSTYQLKVSAEGLPELRSEPIIYRELINIEDVSVRKDTASFSNGNCKIKVISLSVPSLGQDEVIFWAETFLNNSPIEDRSVLGSTGFVKFTKGAERDVLSLEWPDAGVDCSFVEDRLRMLIVATPKEYGAYVVAKDNSFLDLGGVFATPDDIPQNVIGGYGYFGLGSSLELNNL